MQDEGEDEDLEDQFDDERGSLSYLPAAPACAGDLENVVSAPPVHSELVVDEPLDAILITSHHVPVHDNDRSGQRVFESPNASLPKSSNDLSVDWHAATAALECGEFYWREILTTEFLRSSTKHFRRVPGSSFGR